MLYSLFQFFSTLLRSQYLFFCTTWILLFSGMWAVAPAHAFDLTNAGEFAIVHRNGQVTDLTLKITRQAEQWKVQNRDESGHWQDLGCQGDCDLVDSNKEEVAYFMGGEEPEDMATQCIHNVAYALCRVDVDGDSYPQYLFIALVAPPTAVSLVRVVHQKEAFDAVKPKTPVAP